MPVIAESTPCLLIYEFNLSIILQFLLGCNESLHTKQHHEHHNDMGRHMSCHNGGSDGGGGDGGSDCAVDDVRHHDIIAFTTAKLHSYPPG